MIADDLDVFVNSVDDYFKVSCVAPATVGTPFLTTDATQYMRDYTGQISISGNYRGSVFFSAPERMLMRILRDLGLVCTQENKLMDWFSFTLNAEDIDLCENVQKGLHSLGYTQGRFVVDRDHVEFSEHHVHFYQKMVKQALTEPGA